MRVVGRLIITIGLFSLQLRASSPRTKCLDGDSDSLFSTAEVIAFGMSLNGKIPQIESDSDGNPTKLSWAPRPSDTSIEVEQIGRYRNRGIYRVVYQKRSDTPEAPKSRLVCIMFGYQEAMPDGTGIRPFFVTVDEQIASVESYLVSDKDQPFALEIHKTLQGNGVFWTSYTFVFTPTEARITQRSEGGRRMHTKTYSYDNSGKIVKTQTSTEE